MATENQDTTTGTLGADTTPPAPVNQPAAANGVAPDNSLAQQAQQAQQAQHVQHQQQVQHQQAQHHAHNQHHQQNYNQHYGYNMGNYPQNFQPSQQQPLHYPQYGQYYPNHQQQYPPYFYPPVNNVPQQYNYQPQPQPPPPPPPQQPVIQQAAAAGHDRRDTEEGSTMDDDQSDINHDQENRQERRYSGPLADQLHTWAAERKKGPSEGPEIYETLAEFMSHQLGRAFSTQELDQSVKDYPTMKNVPLALAPDLEGEISEYTRLHRDTSLKGTEAALKSIQKGILSALNAFGPLAEVIMKQGAGNEELGEASTPVLDIIKLLANASAGISKKRRDLLIPHIDAKYKKLSKNDEDFDPAFLFGGNLQERARKVKATATLMKEVMKPDNKNQGAQGKSNPQGNRSSNTNNGGYRAPARPAPYPRQQGRTSSNTSGTTTQSTNQGFRRGGSSNQNGNKSRRP